MKLLQIFIINFCHACYWMCLLVIWIIPEPSFLGTGWEDISSGNKMNFLPKYTIILNFLWFYSIGHVSEQAFSVHGFYYFFSANFLQITEVWYCFPSKTQAIKSECGHSCRKFVMDLAITGHNITERCTLVKWWSFSSLIGKSFLCQTLLHLFMLRLTFLFLSYVLFF